MRPDVADPEHAGAEPLGVARRLSATLAVCGLIGGAASLLGWAAGIDRLKDWFGEGIHMKANAAVAAMAAGLAVLALSPRQPARRLARAAACLLTLIGCLTLSQHLIGWNLGIDTLLFDEAARARATVSPGRMGPPASITFTLLGLALLLASIDRRSPAARRRAAVPALGIAAAAIAMLSLIGYLFGARPLFEHAHLTGIALQTSWMLLALAVAVIATVPERQPVRTMLSAGAAGTLARRALPVLIALPVLAGWLRLRAERANLFDAGTGTALLVLTLILLLCVLLWSGVAMVSARETALRDKEDRLVGQRRLIDQLIASSPVAKAIVEGEALRFALINPAFAAIDGGGPLAVGNTWTEAFVRAAPISAEMLREVLRSGQSQKLRDLELPVGNRPRTWWEGEVVPLHPERGQQPACLILLWDVTERTIAERALREHEQLLRSVTEHARVGLATLDRDHRHLYANQAYAEILGLTSSQILDGSVDDLMGREYCEQSRPKLDLAFTGQRVRYELELPPTPGRLRRRFFSVTYEPQSDEGVVTTVVVAVADVSERKQAELEREYLLAAERAARTETERAARLKDEFLATLSHELRTPLNAIVGWVHVLKLGAVDAAKLAQGVEVIERNARLQARLISDLLDMSRVLSGRMRLEEQRVDMKAVVRTAIESVQPAADAKGIGILQAIDADDMTVLGDPARLQQIVWNLLTNAVKFTPGQGRVRVEMARAGNELLVRIVDSGEGIPPEFLPHIFERFRQADASTSRSHGGLGIGLALVKQLVTLHSGRVSAASAGLGKGATFTVQLPLAFAAAGAAPIAPPEAPPDRSAPPHVDAPLAGIRVLVVDDEADALDVARRLLEGFAAVVTTATGVDEALLLLRSREFDAVLSDIGMPHRNGYDLIAEMRQHGLLVPAGAFTAFARPEDAVSLLQAGYRAHLAKPVDPTELLSAVLYLTGRNDPLGSSKRTTAS